MLKLLLSAGLLTVLSTASKCQKSNDSSGRANSKIELEDKVFEKVEREAEFPGGVKAWIQYLQENLNADVPR